ncbi:YfeC-like transcriptional regulator, partial [Escherichia coli]
KPPEWWEKQKGSRGIRRGQWYRLVFQFPIRERPEGQGEAPALSGDAPLEVLLVTLAKEMTPVEQKQFTSLLLREGIIGLLQRLGIRDSK